MDLFIQWLLSFTLFLLSSLFNLIPRLCLDIFLVNMSHLDYCIEVLYYCVSFIFEILQVAYYQSSSCFYQSYLLS